MRVLDQRSARIAFIVQDGNDDVRAVDRLKEALLDASRILLFSVDGVERGRMLVGVFVKAFSLLRTIDTLILRPRRHGVHAAGSLTDHLSVRLELAANFFVTMDALFMHVELLFVADEVEGLELPREEEDLALSHSHLLTEEYQLLRVIERRALGK